MFAYSLRLDCRFTVILKLLRKEQEVIICTRDQSDYSSIDQRVTDGRVQTEVYVNISISKLFLYQMTFHMVVQKVFVLVKNCRTSFLQLQENMVLSFLWEKFYIDSYPFTQHLLNLQIDELSKETEKKLAYFAETPLRNICFTINYFNPAEIV